MVSVEDLNKIRKEQEYQEQMRVEYENIKQQGVGHVEGEWVLLESALLRAAVEVCDSKKVEITYVGRMRMVR